MTNEATTKTPIVKATGTVRNPPHGSARLPTTEARAEAVVEPPKQDER